MNINNKPDLSLGAIVLSFDIDTRKCSIQIENSHTMQLTSPEELINLLSKTGFNLFCDELKRRSKTTVVA